MCTGELYKRHLLWSLMNCHLVAVAALEMLIIVPLFSLLAFWVTPNWEWTNLPNLRVGQFFLRINLMLPLLGAAILAGLDTPSSGQVIVDQVDITHMGEGQLARFRDEKIGISLRWGKGRRGTHLQN